MRFRAKVKARAGAGGSSSVRSNSLPSVDLIAWAGSFGSSDEIYSIATVALDRWEETVSDTAIHPETQSQVVYRSVVRVEPQPGGIKLVHLPCESEPVPMGLHGAIARHYKMSEGAFTPHAATLDYIVEARPGASPAL